MLDDVSARSVSTAVSVNEAVTKLKNSLNLKPSKGQVFSSHYYNESGVAQVIVKFKKDKHWYYVKDKINRPESNSFDFCGSVSTISKQLDKSNWLVPWASKLVAESAMDMLLADPKLREDIFENNNQEALVSFIKTVKGLPRSKKEQGGVRGDVIHELINAVGTGIMYSIPLKQLSSMIETSVTTNDNLDDAFLPAILKMAEFLYKDVDEIIGCEIPVYSTEDQYVGTGDLFYINRNGNLVYFDGKSGKGVYDEHHLSTSGYMKGFVEELMYMRAHDSLANKFDSKALNNISLENDNLVRIIGLFHAVNFTFKPFLLETDFETDCLGFLGARGMYWWKQQG